MSILSIELTPELDARLEALAASRRADKAQVAREMIEAGLPVDPRPETPGAPIDPQSGSAGDLAGRIEPPDRPSTKRDYRTLDLQPFPDGLTFGDLTKDVCGMFEGPGDLSTNPKYMEGFGED